jgi:flagellar basal-body rod modification protein FlgD
MDNSEMVQQIGQIREIGATDELTKTLSSLSSSQELVTASSLIGKSVEGLAEDASAVDGIVDRITVETSDRNDARTVKVHVGGKTMDIKNIREIQTG